MIEYIKYLINLYENKLFFITCLTMMIFSVRSMFLHASNNTLKTKIWYHLTTGMTIAILICPIFIWMKLYFIGAIFFIIFICIIPICFFGGMQRLKNKQFVEYKKETAINLSDLFTFIIFSSYYIALFEATSERELKKILVMYAVAIVFKTMDDFHCTIKIKITKHTSIKLTFLGFPETLVLSIHSKPRLQSCYVLAENENILRSFRFGGTMMSLSASILPFILFPLFIFYQFLYKCIFRSAPDGLKKLDNPTYELINFSNDMDQIMSHIFIHSNKIELFIILIFFVILCLILRMIHKLFKD